MQLAKEKVAQADTAERAGQGSRAIYESAGAARAMVEAKRQWLSTREARRTAREAIARDLRRQIEDLRAQLARYAEALEEDLASGREKVAARTREGIRMEQTFTDGSHALTEALKDRPECRDLMAQLKSTDGPRETPEQPWTNASGRVVS